MKRRIRAEISGVCAGQGKPCRHIIDADSGELLGDVCKHGGNNRLWLVGKLSTSSLVPEVPMEKKAHASFSLALAYAKSHFAEIVRWRCIADVANSAGIFRCPNDEVPGKGYCRIHGGLER